MSYDMNYKYIQFHNANPNSNSNNYDNEIKFNNNIIILPLLL